MRKNLPGLCIMFVCSGSLTLLIHSSLRLTATILPVAVSLFRELDICSANCLPYHCIRLSISTRLLICFSARDRFAFKGRPSPYPITLSRPSSMLWFWTRYWRTESALSKLSFKLCSSLPSESVWPLIKYEFAISLGSLSAFASSSSKGIDFGRSLAELTSNWISRLTLLARSRSDLFISMGLYSLGCHPTFFLTLIPWFYNLPVV